LYGKIQSTVQSCCSHNEVLISVAPQFTPNAVGYGAVPYAALYCMITLETGLK